MLLHGVLLLSPLVFTEVDGVFNSCCRRRVQEELKLQPFQEKLPTLLERTRGRAGALEDSEQVIDLSKSSQVVVHDWDEALFPTTWTRAFLDNIKSGDFSKAFQNIKANKRTPKPHWLNIFSVSTDDSEEISLPDQESIVERQLEELDDLLGTSILLLERSMELSNERTAIVTASQHGMIECMLRRITEETNGMVGNAERLLAMLDFHSVESNFRPGEQDHETAKRDIARFKPQSGKIAVYAASKGTGTRGRALGFKKFVFEHGILLKSGWGYVETSKRGRGWYRFPDETEWTTTKLLYKLESVHEPLRFLALGDCVDFEGEALMHMLKVLNQDSTQSPMIIPRFLHLLIGSRVGKEWSCAVDCEDFKEELQHVINAYMGNGKNWQGLWNGTLKSQTSLKGGGNLVKLKTRQQDLKEAVAEYDYDDLF